MKAYAEWRYSSTILDLGTRCEWSASHPCRFTPSERAPRYGRAPAVQSNRRFTDWASRPVAHVSNIQFHSSLSDLCFVIVSLITYMTIFIPEMILHRFPATRLLQIVPSLSTVRIVAQSRDFHSVSKSRIRGASLYLLYPIRLHGVVRVGTGTNLLSVVGWATMLQAMRSLDFFNWPKPSSRTMALGSTQPLAEMSTRNIPGG
jgi:hypothetical protein